MKNNLPELLAPAGSPDALDAALAAGADAVYFGAKTLNARHGAENFDDVSLFDAVKSAAHSELRRISLSIRRYTGGSLCPPCRLSESF
jgi:collagenase-like PrtC family protease